MDAEAAPERRRHDTSSLGAALSRSAAFMFSRPIRLFRPTKVSGWTALGELSGRSALSPSVLLAIAKSEGWALAPRYLLPPAIINALAGFSLFATFNIVNGTLQTLVSERSVIPNVTCAAESVADQRLPSDSRRMCWLCSGYEGLQ